MDRSRIGCFCCCCRCCSDGLRLQPRPSVLFPHWNYLPTPVLEQVAACFTSLRDVLQTMLVCKKWYYALSDDRSEIWAIFAGRRLSKAVLKSPVLYSLPSYKAKLRALSYAWDAAECSRNIFIKPNGFTLHRNPAPTPPAASSASPPAATAGRSAGRGPLGTVAVVGVATKEATLQAAGYVPLIGSNVHSWGWNLVENSLVHGGHCTGAYPRLANAPRYQTGDRLRIILDCDSQTLAFERDYEFLGIAFFSLPKKPLYPAVSAVYGNTEISMVYLGWPLDG
ncbi:F-box/SPRY domain-containing protein 1 [Tyrophagus putrescentiae]|nr:F-box/SPRY domain-containing protein 1 [Tyrophagus putrescentiae]